MLRDSDIVADDFENAESGIPEFTEVEPEE